MLETVEGEDARVITCLQDYREELLDTQCKIQVHKLTQRASQDIRMDEPLADACYEDRSRLCVGVQPVRPHKQDSAVAQALGAPGACCPSEGLQLLVWDCSSQTGWHISRECRLCRDAAGSMHAGRGSSCLRQDALNMCLALLPFG